MKKIGPFMIAVVLAAVVCTFISFSTTNQKEESSTATSQMIADWERAKAYTKEYLDAASEEAINFKPNTEMRSFGEQMLHLSEANFGLGATALGKTSPYAFGQLEKSDQYKTKAALTKIVLESYDFVISGIKETDPSKLGEMVKVFNFDMSREVALSKTFEHQTHHRGQTTVYLRLKGIKPPQEKLF